MLCRSPQRGAQPKRSAQLCSSSRIHAGAFGLVHVLGLPWEEGKGQQKERQSKAGARLPGSGTTQLSDAVFEDANLLPPGHATEPTLPESPSN